MTKIEWATETWNPIVGCSKVSPGCQNCYALRMAVRLANNPKLPKEVREAYASVIHKVNGKWEWNGRTALIESALEKALLWRKPRMIFVCSMGDLFHEAVPFEWIDKVFTIMTLKYQHTFLLLTKRPDRMQKYFSAGKENLVQIWEDVCYDLGIAYEDDPDAPACFICNRTLSDIKADHFGWPLTNVWLGVTAENQEQANKRIPILLQIPAAKRFVSVEPMLGSIDFYDIPYGNQFHNVLTGVLDISTSQSGIIGDKLDWVICGGESGPGARPMHPDWVRSIRDQCKESGVPFMFKQWGDLLPNCQLGTEHTGIKLLNHKTTFQSPHNPLKMNTYYRIGKKKAGRLLDGVKHNEFPINQ